jgi:hypothetical protein
MAQHKIFVGTYRQYDGIEVTIRRTCVVRRHYTHAIIPYYTTRSVSAPCPGHPHLTIRVQEPCQPRYGKAQFCGSLALAEQRLKPGWILVEVREL